MNMSYDDFDFIGFTFNGQHSSEFNLLRISDGNRYEDTLVPNLSNETAEIPGGLGSYYWGEQIKSREFKIEIAYDNVGELEKRQIKRWLHPDDKLHELIFDEKPYVKYWVKCNREVVSKELCFNDNGKRVYKGEMTIQFIAPMPYGVVVNKDLSEYENNNKNEWAESSGLKEGNSQVFNNSQHKIYNPGDVPSDFVLEYKQDATWGTFKIENPPELRRRPIKVTKLPESITTDGTYYIFYLTSNDYQRYNFSGGDRNNCTLTGSIDKKTIYGYIDETIANNPRFVDEFGNFYSFYTGNDNVATYKLSNKPASDGAQYAFDDNGNSYFVYIEAEGSHYLTFLEPENNNFKGALYLNANEIYRVKIELQDRGTTINSLILETNTNILGSYSELTESQKMLMHNCTIRIDSSKQNVSYQIEGHNEWIGITDLISEGTIFKIPLEFDTDKPKIIEITKHTTTIDIKNPNISYDYYYI